MIHAPMHLLRGSPAQRACSSPWPRARIGSGAFTFGNESNCCQARTPATFCPKILRLNDYVPGWKSKKFRIGSWLFVAACGTLGAAWTTLLLRGPDIRPGIGYFLAILLARWVLSAITGIGAANYSLRKYGTGFQGTATQETGYRLQGSVEKSHHSVPGTGHRL